MKRKVVVFCGPPGAGKGTQARNFAQARGYRHLATGDLMRSERESGSPLGRRFDQYMRAGKLVPDDLVFDLVSQELELAGEDGLVFDGFPRTAAQAEQLDIILRETGRAIGRVVWLEVPTQELVRRLSGRRVCVNCGQVYHVDYTPPPASGLCKNCGQGPIVQRKDDEPDIIRNRVASYDLQTRPLLDYYKARDLVNLVDGVGSTETVSERVATAVVTA